MPADPQLAVDLEGIRAYEPGKPVKGVNPEMSVARLLFCWHRVREGSFECDEFRPFDADIALDAVTAHPSDAVDPLRAADQHLLRIASPQRARSAEWAVIDLVGVRLPLTERQGRRLRLNRSRPGCNPGHRRHR